MNDKNIEYKFDTEKTKYEILLHSNYHLDVICFTFADSIAEAEENVLNQLVIDMPEIAASYVVVRTKVIL